MSRFGSGHCNGFSMAEFMINGTAIFAELAKLLDGHEAGGGRHNGDSMTARADRPLEYTIIVLILLSRLLVIARPRTNVEWTPCGRKLPAGLNAGWCGPALPTRKERRSNVTLYRPGPHLPSSRRFAFPERAAGTAQVPLTYRRFRAPRLLTIIRTGLPTGGVPYCRYFRGDRGLRHTQG